MNTRMCIHAWDSVADVDVVEAVVDEVQLRRRCQARRYYRQYHLCVCVCVCVCVYVCVASLQTQLSIIHNDIGRVS